MSTGIDWAKRYEGPTLEQQLATAVDALREIAVGGHAARFVMANGRTAEDVARTALVALGRSGGEERKRA